MLLKCVHKLYNCNPHCDRYSCVAIFSGEFQIYAVFQVHEADFFLRILRYLNLTLEIMFAIAILTFTCLDSLKMTM